MSRMNEQERARMMRRYEEVSRILERYYDARLTACVAQRIHELEQESRELEQELFGAEKGERDNGL